MTANAVKAERTPLEERLIALIKANGPITVADYMSDALGHPHDGYYTSQSPIGADGDFTTAPEISQIFGELIGLWLIQSWTEMGAPAFFNLVELGPGRGVLMADILRAALLRPKFREAAHILLVEKSGRLRVEQRRRLKGVPTVWADSFAETPPGPILLVANEFFDCLPISQYVRTAAGWRERLIDAAADGSGLVFRAAPTPPLPSVHLPELEDSAIGTVFETCSAATELAGEIARALVAQGGRALIIDYGRLGGIGETLQAVRGHGYWPVLASPGRADITAHVNFEALARAAIAAGATVWGPVSQEVFLERLGVRARAERLSKGRSQEEAAAIARDVARLASPEQMGEVFRAMALSSPPLPPPAGFEP